VAEHVWEGGYGMQQGAILARLVGHAEKEGRIHDGVDFDPAGRGIEVSSDIGFRDTASFWFWQRKLGGFSLLDYDGDSGLDAQDWIVRLQQRLTERGWPLGKIWLPHDARQKTFQSKHSVIEQFVGAFGLGKCAIVEQSSKLDRINAARTILRRSEFHKTRCEAGLDGLRAWEYEWNPDTLSFSREPLHNWASHPSDAYSYGCQIMLEPQPPPPEPSPPKHVFEANGMGGVKSNLPIRELIERQARRRREDD
jgi:phage terminase large subunit